MKAKFMLGVIALTGFVGMEPARADYPWCIQNSESGYPGDCAYQSREQCLVSLSGRKGYCGENPSALFRRPRPQLVPKGRHIWPN
jgi:hypothetical protein